jgi:hypothetical protein
MSLTTYARRYKGGYTELLKRDQTRYPKTAAALLSLINRLNNKTPALATIIRQKLSVAEKIQK